MTSNGHYVLVPYKVYIKYFKNSALKKGSVTTILDESKIKKNQIKNKRIKKTQKHKHKISKRDRSSSESSSDNSTVSTFYRNRLILKHRIMTMRY